jgi:predicted membrane-bound mannosyltransferase
MRIYENYKSFVAPIGVRERVEKMVSAVRSDYLVGLSSIVLTDSNAQESERTWRLKGRKLKSQTSYGLYHPASPQREAWIELLLDNIFADGHPVLMRFAVAQDVVIASTLYHEIGHHLEAMTVKGRSDRETAADGWVSRLGKPYFKRRYWFLLPVITPVRYVFRFVKNRGHKASMIR